MLLQLPAQKEDIDIKLLSVAQKLTEIDFKKWKVVIIFCAGLCLHIQTHQDPMTSPHGLIFCYDIAYVYVKTYLFHGQKIIINIFFQK